MFLALLKKGQFLPTSLIKYCWGSIQAMNNKPYSRVLILILLVSACGGSKHIWRSEPPLQSYSNRYFYVAAGPIILFDGYGAFVIKVKNKSGKNILINWNKTIYIHNGNANGGLMFEGISYEKRNFLIPPDIIQPKRTLAKILFPNNLILESNGVWTHKPMKEGENALYVTLIANGKEIGSKFTFYLSKVSSKRGWSFESRRRVD